MFLSWKVLLYVIVIVSKCFIFQCHSYYLDRFLILFSFFDASNERTLKFPEFVSRPKLQCASASLFICLCACPICSAKHVKHEIHFQCHCIPCQKKCCMDLQVVLHCSVKWLFCLKYLDRFLGYNFVVAVANKASQLAIVTQEATLANVDHVLICEILNQTPF